MTVSTEQTAPNSQRLALWDAIEGNDPARLKVLLQAPSLLGFPLTRLAHNNGAHKHVSMLHLAAHRGYADVCRVLIEAGVEIHVCSDFKDEIDTFFPLDLARKNGHDDVIRLLEQESDKQGISAESMEPCIERDPDGGMQVVIRNFHTGEALDYGRALIAHDTVLRNLAGHDPRTIQVQRTLDEP